MSPKTTHLKNNKTQTPNKTPLIVSSKMIRMLKMITFIVEDLMMTQEMIRKNLKRIRKNIKRN